MDGLRQGIVGGFYRPGDVVPSYRDLSSMLGVSQIVTKAALRQLAGEGYIRISAFNSRENVLEAIGRLENAF